MDVINVSNLRIVEPRLDWLGVISTTNKISMNSAAHKKKIKTCMEAMGFEQMDRRSPSYRKPEIGLEITFKRKRNDGGTEVKVEFQGLWCANNHALIEGRIRHILDHFQMILELESPWKVTRLDIAIDFFGVDVSDVFPDFSTGHYYLKSIGGDGKSSSSPVTIANFYTSDGLYVNQTGSSIQNSRFKYRAYDRRVMLDKYAKKEFRGDYVDYYLELYGDELKVVRLELEIKKERCQYFNDLFFGNENLEKRESLPEILKLTLANFNKNTKIMDHRTGDEVTHLKSIHFSPFAETLKTMRIRKGYAVDLEKAYFVRKNLCLDSVLTNLARLLIELKIFKPEDMQIVLKLLLMKMRKEKDFLKKRAEGLRKYHETYNYTEYEATQEERDKIEKFHKRVNEIDILEDEEIEREFSVPFIQSLYLDSLEDLEEEDE